MKQRRPLYGASLKIVLLLLTGVEAQALFNVELPSNEQSKISTPMLRTVSLKLPISNDPFHWEFLDAQEVLQGKLVLTITRTNSVQEIVIFDRGSYRPGWGPLITESLGKTGANPLYFGFISTNLYLTAPGDRIGLDFTASKNLDGIGPLLRGYLPKGTYHSDGKYSVLTDEPQGLLAAHEASIECWQPQWSVVETCREGWIPPEQTKQLREMYKNLK